jgi:hypothetical protein
MKPKHFLYSTVVAASLSYLPAYAQDDHQLEQQRQQESQLEENTQKKSSWPAILGAIAGISGGLALGYTFFLRPEMKDKERK